jgi:hypothetical protein
VKYHMSFHWRTAWGRRRAEPESESPQVDGSVASSEVAQTSSSQLAHAINHPLSASTAATTKDFQPLQLSKSQEDAKRVAALRVEVEKALPVCMVTRLRAAKALDKSTNDNIHNSEDA